MTNRYQKHRGDRVPNKHSLCIYIELKTSKFELTNPGISNFTLHNNHLFCILKQCRKKASLIMASTPVVLILGSGPRIGAALTKAFSKSGFRVAVASRTKDGSKSDGVSLSLKADFNDPKSIPALFEAVRAEFGTAPSTVIYNAAALTPPSEESSLFSITADSIASDLNVNTISPYVAAQQAILAWETLPEGTKKTFIYTGNALNNPVLPVPLYLNLGIGKAASAYWIGTADALYSAKGIR